jgi:perosamine synthetase
VVTMTNQFFSQKQIEMRIPVNTISITGNEKKYINECIDTGWISSEGPFIKKFEENLAAKVDRSFGIAVCNGSVAIDVAIAAMNIGSGDEVIMPTFTIISCAAAIIRAGAKPVLIDSDEATWNMNVSLIESKITPRTKAIMIVHIYGLPVDVKPVLELCERYKLVLIEDAAEAHGQTYYGKPCGSFGEISTFSFYPNKHITTGEGGMVMTDRHDLAARCRLLRNLCFTPEKRFVHEELGFNFRMTNLQAALGVAQLEKLDNTVIRKREIGLRYHQNLKSQDYFQLPVQETAFAKNIYWVFGLVILNSRVEGEEMIKKLAEAGIGSRPFFWCMHEQPIFKKMGLFSGEMYPVAERLARKGFYLPSGIALTDAEIDEVCATLHRLIA